MDGSGKALRWPGLVRGPDAAVAGVLGSDTCGQMVRGPYEALQVVVCI